MRKDEDIDRLAAQIGAENSHGYRRHIHEFSQTTPHGGPLPVTNAKEYESHIADTLKSDSTKGFTTADGRGQYYNEGTNTFVADNPRARDHGTAFRPKDGPAHYGRLQKADQAERADRGLPEAPSVESGGYHALQERNQASNEGQANSQAPQPEAAASSRSAMDRMDAHWSPPPPPPPPSEGPEESESQPRGRSR